MLERLGLKLRPTKEHRQQGGIEMTAIEELKARVFIDYGYGQEVVLLSDAIAIVEKREEEIAELLQVPIVEADLWRRLCAVIKSGDRGYWYKMPNFVTPELALIDLIETMEKKK
jgi:hypothetical protein